MSALRKKRKHINDEDVDDEEDILVHSSDDDDIVEGMPSSSASKKQRKLPHNTLESNKKKPVTHHKPARALNDAFKDFQSNFGLSSPSASTAEARSTPSIHKVKQSGFKSSFGNDAPATKDTSTRDATTRGRLPPQVRSNSTTSLKQSSTSKSGKSGASILRPPESHKRLFDETSRLAPARKDTSKSVDKGKGRATEADEPSSDDSNPLEKVGEEPSSGVEDNAKSRQPGVTPLLNLSAKKHFKVPSTPSKPSPLSGRHLPISTSHRQETPSEDVKPLRSLGAISGLELLRKPSTASTSSHQSNQGVINSIETQEGREREEEEQPKPKWAKLLDDKTKSELSMKQDIIELLSPRKKRKGWVPSGLAENSSSIIKRLQTGNNLWIHEISRTLTSFSNNNKASSSSSSTTTTHSTIKKENTEASMKSSKNNSNSNNNDGNKKSFDNLTRNLNPHLRLIILEILSPKPASLTWSSQEGGFITAGAAEKLLITRCRILKDEDEDDENIHALSNAATSSRSLIAEEQIQSQEIPSASAIANKEWESQIEGMVIFSLTAHSRTSTGITMVRKEQARPPRNDNAERNEDQANLYQNEDRFQPQLKFKDNENNANDGRKKKKNYNVYLPASIADLHTQMRVEDEIWAWEPWSIVDLLNDTSLQAHSAREDAVESERIANKSNEKALLVSRFAVLL